MLLYEMTGREEDCINKKLVEEGFAKVWKRIVNRQEIAIFLPVRPDESCPGQRTACRVVLARSPARILVRKICEEKQFYQLCSDLSIHFSDSQRNRQEEARHWGVGAGCVARVQGEGWARVQILTELVGGEVEVMLVDYGEKQVIGADMLRELPEKFSMSPMASLDTLEENITLGYEKLSAPIPSEFACFTAALVVLALLEARSYRACPQTLHIHEIIIVTNNLFGLDSFLRFSVPINLSTLPRSLQFFSGIVDSEIYPSNIYISIHILYGDITYKNLALGMSLKRYLTKILSVLMDTNC